MHNADNLAGQLSALEINSAPMMISMEKPRQSNNSASFIDLEKAAISTDFTEKSSIGSTFQWNADNPVFNSPQFSHNQMVNSARDSRHKVDSYALQQNKLR